MTKQAQRSYSIPEVREMLRAFNHAGLIALCQDLTDQFPTLSQSVGLGSGLREDEIINLVLDFFRRRGDFSPLVDAINQRRSVSPSPPVSPPPPLSPLSDGKGHRLVILELERDFEGFTASVRDHLVFVLSRLLGISPAQIRILYVTEGSVLVTLEMPEQAAKKLRSMHWANDPALQGLHIKRVEFQPDGSLVPPISPPSNTVWLQRLTDLNDNIAQDIVLLKKYEDAWRYEDDPGRQAKYEREIKRLRESLKRYQDEYDDLKVSAIGEPREALSSLGVQLQQMDNGLKLLDEELELHRQRQAVLARYEPDDQSTVAIPVEHLDQSQLADVQAILDVLKVYHLLGVKVGRMVDAAQKALVALQERGISVPNQQEIVQTLSAPELDIKHRFKLTLPIIPILLSYEGELEYGTGMNLKDAWKRLKRTPQRFKWLIGFSVIAVPVLVFTHILLSSLWQPDVSLRLILAGILCGSFGGAFLVISSWVSGVTTRRVWVMKSLPVVIGVLLFTIGLVPKTVTAIQATVCRYARIPTCLKLDLATGIDQEICPDGSEMLVLPPGSLDGLVNLSGRATLTPKNLCTCEWEGQTKEGRPLKSLHGLPKDCSFSFALPDEPADTYYLTLKVGGKYEMFTINVQQP